MQDHSHHQYIMTSSRVRSVESIGFTLIELLIVSALGGLVISAIGAIIISQIRQNIGFETRRQLVEDWGRVASFIESELFLAERIYPVSGDTTGSTITTRATAEKVCNFDPATIKLSMVLNDTTTYITYAVDAIQEEERNLWNGPYVLRRCGPLDSSSDTSTGALTGEPKSSVLIGDLADASAFSATRGINTLGEATAARDVSIKLEVKRSSVSHSGSFGGQARVSPSYNLLNDEANTSSSCGSPSTTALLCGSNTVLEFNTTNCPVYNDGDYSGVSRESLDAQYNCDISRVHQFKPSGISTVQGSTQSSREDTIYLEGPLANYKPLHPSSCTSKSCVVESKDGKTKITILDGDVLAFQDRELRL